MASWLFISRAASTSWALAETMSQHSMMRRRSQRSTRAPANGAISSAGTAMATKISANWVVDPVVRKTQMPSAKLDRREPMPDVIWPNQISKKSRKPA